MAKETGFPSPAQGYEAEEIDLNTYLISNRPATFFMRMAGFALEYKGILDGDILLIDRSRNSEPGSLVAYQWDGEFFCRELVKTAEGLGFITEDQEQPLRNDMIFFGTVTAVVRKL